jgi:hypothetical protein
MKSQTQLDLELEKQEQEATLNREAEKQTENPPFQRKQWIDHINKCLGPVVKYILKRFNEGGCRFDSNEFFHGTRVFGSVYAAYNTVQEAHGLLEKLRKYPALDNDATIKALKSSFPQFKHITSAMNLMSVGGILQWRFDLQKSFLVGQEQDGHIYGCHHC